MALDLERLAERAGLDSGGLLRRFEEDEAALSGQERVVFKAAMEIADKAVNRSATAPTLVARLVELARSVAGDPAARRVRGDGTVLGTGLRRTLSARTLHVLSELGLYEDINSVAPVWPHAGMLILNPMLGCSFGCVYCFRADEQRESVDWFLNGRPTQVIEEEAVIERLERHPLFIPGLTQIGLHTATTEPFLPQVRESTFRLLDLLEERGWGNDVMIITKHFVRDKDVERLSGYRSFQIMLFLTHNAAPAEMETMGAAPGFLARKQRTVELLAGHPRLLAAHYYRPIVPGWNDGDEQIAEALSFGEPLGLTVIGGLKGVPHLPESSLRRGLSLPVVAKGAGEEKHFPDELVGRILTVHRRLGLTSTIVGDQSCGLTVMLSRDRGTAVPNVEAVKMYDSVPGRRPKCMALCPADQLAACGHPPVPEPDTVRSVLARTGIPASFRISADGVRLRSARPLSVHETESVAAHLRFAVFAQHDSGHNPNSPSGLEEDMCDDH
ncbi:hypothetical protein GXW83_23800 [Streptacidiphilus sp. PB12-B1b]|uniref:hypothetical protein n=1 Tax=Streptacidiphilus sp. PB12-B1b TaxID=2705012 RepID=UPI0015FC6D6B|nr:hypothetical protein [Streptacidiphilus sp. PB12-B1b]QMU78277.1 hypothetical protein GXW83_23800 [Streptacidiphilus sp. PB12-B1b]